MDTNLIIILVIVVLIILISSKSDKNKKIEGFSVDKDIYNEVVKSRNPEDLEKNIQKCYNYCTSNKNKYSHCSHKCNETERIMSDYLSSQRLIFGRYPTYEMSIIN